MKQLITAIAATVVLLLGGILVGCGGDAEGNAGLSKGSEPSADAAEPSSEPAAEEASGGGDIGVGPIKRVSLGAVDAALATKGEEIFTSKCAACHKYDERYVGPPLRAVTERRKPEWIMNMIMNPAEMVQKDPAAKQLLAEFMTQMPPQNVTEADARALLEHLRKIAGEAPVAAAH